MRELIGTLWQGFSYVGRFAKVISKSETHAATLGKQALKSGRDMWETLKTLETAATTSLG
jgi:hypothetical protein